MRFIYKERNIPLAIILTTCGLAGLIFVRSQTADLFYPYFIEFFLIVFILLWINLLIKFLKSKNNPSFIVLSENHIEFPYRKEKQVIKYNDIDRLFTVKYDIGTTDNPSDVLKTILITKNNRRYEFEENKFSSTGQFDTFNYLLKSACKNLSPVK